MNYGLLGYLGGGLLSVQMLPQIIKVYKQKDASQLSLSFMICNLVGLGCMSAYGILNRDPPIFIPTTCSFVNTCVLISQKCFYGYGTSNKQRTTQTEETLSPAQCSLPVSIDTSYCCPPERISHLNQPLTLSQRP